MYTNVNLAAPVGVLSFLGTGFLLFLIGLALVYSITKRKVRLTRLALLAMTVIAAIYCGVALLFSLTSHETVLARGQEKHFCEIDCHLAYSVTDVREAKTLGEGPNQVTAGGMFRVVTIKTRFDETTTSLNRGSALLYPNSRVVVVMDDTGKKYAPSSEGQRVVETTQSSGTPITTPLRPSDTYMTTFVFDLPLNVSNPTLLIREGELVTHFVIGHENSPFHKTTRFQI